MEPFVGEPFPDSDDPSLSADVIEALAQETNRPIADVKRVFESEFARLKRDARVTDYLVLFASRRARESLVRGTF
jgi:hypothetical protein